MKVERIWIFVTVTMLALAGCHKAEPPATVQSDLAQAREAAAENEAKANQKAAEAVASANDDMAVQSQKADQKTADAAYDVAVARADGDHKIAIAKCEGLSGEVQKACVLRSIWPRPTRKRPGPEGRRRAGPRATFCRCSSVV